MTTTAEPNAARTGAEPPPPLNPPERLLMGPGPSNPDPRVLAAMGANPVGHLDPYFVELMDQTMGALRGVYRTQNHHTLPISATGSAGLETIMLNLLEDGDSAVVAITGYFGQRLAETVEGYWSDCSVARHRSIGRRTVRRTGHSATIVWPANANQPKGLGRSGLYSRGLDR